MNMNYQRPDLAQHPPRSPRVRLGGFAHLPRLLDKCRASIAGKNAEYQYGSPMDQRFLQFTGLDPEILRAEVAKGLSDAEIIAWITANASHKLSGLEISQWSAMLDHWAPGDNGTRAWFNERVAEASGAHRQDITGFFDYLDIDDYTAFGGKA